LLDQIEHTVSQSVNFTSKGVEELRGANKAQRSYRKKLCCMVGILLILMIIIIAPILSKQLKNVR
jgi:syntaxin 1B/2/3